MSIQSEISRITRAKETIAQAIWDKGVEVPFDATLDEFPAYVGQIQVSSGGIGEYLGAFNTQGGVIDSSIDFGNRTFSALVAESDTFTCSAVGIRGIRVANASNTWISNIYSSSLASPAKGWLTFQNESGDVRMNWTICPDGSMSDQAFTLYGIG